MLIDTHAHLDDRSFDEDREAVIERAREKGLVAIINVGYNYKTIQTTLALAEKHDFIFAVIGWHPNDAHRLEERHYEWIEGLARTNPKVVGIGEIGLDYYRTHAPRERQQEIFRRQIALARKLKLPIIIHDRDAHKDLLDIMREEKASEVGGIMHSYSGSLETAHEAIKMGFDISFSGPITFQNAKMPKHVAANIPLENILIETDCPYLTPEPFRGKRNESSYVGYVAEEIARLRGMSLDEVKRITTDNALRRFGLKFSTE
jgi:TatD DNase family protein